MTPCSHERVIEVAGGDSATLFGLYPSLLKLYADAGYQGLKFQTGLARVCREVNVEIVRRCDVGKFVVLPKRWLGRIR